jgi:uncharacterized membrane protein YeiB
MSSNIQEVYGTLTKIDELLKDIELRIEKISGGKNKTGAENDQMLSLQKQVRTLNVMIMLIDEVAVRTGSADIDGALDKLRQIVMWAMRARIALQAVQAAMVPGAGWASALYAGVNIAALGLSVYDATVGYQ